MWSGQGQNIITIAHGMEGIANTGFRLSTSSIDEGRPFKIVVIGAGYSGILAGIRSVRLQNEHVLL